MFFRIVKKQVTLVIHCSISPSGERQVTLVLFGNTFSQRQGMNVIRW